MRRNALGFIAACLMGLGVGSALSGDRAGRQKGPWHLALGEVTRECQEIDVRSLREDIAYTGLPYQVRQRILFLLFSHDKGYVRAARTPEPTVEQLAGKINRWTAKHYPGLDIAAGDSYLALFTSEEVGKLVSGGAGTAPDVYPRSFLPPVEVPSSPPMISRVAPYTPPAYTPPTRYRSFVPKLYIGVGGGHWITEVSGSGKIIELEDGSTWRVSPLDEITSALWLHVTDIIVKESRDPFYAYLLINKDDGEKVHAKLISP
jgi:hypothetical protein